MHELDPHSGFAPAAEAGETTHLDHKSGPLTVRPSALESVAMRCTAVLMLMWSKWSYCDSTTLSTSRGFFASRSIELINFGVGTSSS